MCGIAGKTFFHGGREVPRHTVECMTDVMAHRGPNDRGFYYGKGCGLGHRRLSILDLSSAGHQPMCNEDGTVWVVFNGEIYNYKQLRARLKSHGHVFKSNTDTEVIVHAYEEYSTDCVKHFHGMFAFAIWDERKRRLFLSRDHFGIKPLYYFAGKDFISFGSEIKAILEDEDVPKSVDLQALSNFLSIHYVPAPRTMFEGIRKLYPGHNLVVEDGVITVEKYWELQKQEPLRLQDEELSEYVYCQLEHSVDERLQSDVPVGTLLSGGLDSTAVLGLMTEITGKPIPAFSVGYSNDGQDGFSEFHYSRLAAKHYRADYHEMVVTPQMFLDFLPQAVWHQDEPIGEPASIPLYFVCKLAKERGVTVLLSGEGSDELFAGYNRHIGETFSKKYGSLPRSLHRSAEWLLSMLPRVSTMKKGHRSMLLTDFWKRYQSWHTVFSNDLKHELLISAEDQVDSFVDMFDAYRQSHDGFDSLDQMLWLDAKVWLPDDLLMKKDKMGMATSLEARVPFLDHRFAEMAFSISSDLKVKNLSGKHILKKSMEGLVPKEIIYRKKAGFPTPISRWMAHDLRGAMAEILNDSSAGSHGLFDRKVVQRLFDEHVTGRENHERLLFPILNFNLWYRTFFSKTSSHRCLDTLNPLVA